MNSGFQQYKEQKEQSVNTMTPNELLLLLFDELVKRITRAELALQKQEFALFEDSATRCMEIVRYLDDTLDRHVPISDDLHRMYDYFYYALTRIKFGRSLEQIQDLKPMFLDLREAFRTADKTAAEGSDPAPLVTPTAAEPAPPAPASGE